MIPRLSRNQPMSAPATATEPSSAYVVGPSPSRAATVVISPCCDVDRSIAGVHQHEAAGPVGALALPRLETGLPEERRVLVAEIARDRHAGEVADAVAIDLGRRPDPREHRRRDPHGIEQMTVPSRATRAPSASFVRRS